MRFRHRSIFLSVVAMESGTLTPSPSPHIPEQLPQSKLWHKRFSLALSQGVVSKTRIPCVWNFYSLYFLPSLLKFIIWQTITHYADAMGLCQLFEIQLLFIILFLIQVYFNIVYCTVLSIFLYFQIYMYPYNIFLYSTHKIKNYQIIYSLLHK